jgi:pyruvate dehydrogenase E2 component (dihydrolipoamide acetyltransferase)
MLGYDGIANVCKGAAVAFEIVMPRLSDAMEEGTILQWLVASGDAVQEGDPLVEVETDKATVTYESEHSGTVLELAAGEGDSVAVGARIAVVGSPGEQLASAPLAAAAVGAALAAAGQAAAGQAAAEPAAGAPPAAAEPAARPPAPGRVKASPLARRIAAELGIELASLAGSGPAGRVIRADVERAGERAAPASAAPASGAHASAKGEARRDRPSSVQRTIVQRMAQSRATVPDFELRCQVEMSAAVALRERLRAVLDPPPSYNDLIVKAVALALREFPRVNGSYQDGALETYSRINVGIAVAAEEALLVPTIFDADRKPLAEVGREARALVQAVRDGSITPAQLSGATFTVSNLGMFGVDSFSAVINPPQAAILAVGSLAPRAVVDESGEVVARQTVQLTLACDHRILYGADGARFIARVRELLQAPLALLV